MGGVEVGVHPLCLGHLALLRIIDQDLGLDDILALDRGQDPDQFCHLLLLILLDQDTQIPLLRVDALEHLLLDELIRLLYTNERDHARDQGQDQGQGQDHLPHHLVWLELTLPQSRYLSARGRLWRPSMLLLPL